MNKFLICLLVCSSLVVGCASNDPKDPPPKAQTAPPSDQKDLNPEVGWTKEQVIARYGKTDRITSSSEGEVWVYMLNMGQAFIPFNFGYRPKVLTITFDPNTAKVSRWTYSH